MVAAAAAMMTITIYNDDGDEGSDGDEDDHNDDGHNFFIHSSLY